MPIPLIVRVVVGVFILGPGLVSPAVTAIPPLARPIETVVEPSMPAAMTQNPILGMTRPGFVLADSWEARD